MFSVQEKRHIAAAVEKALLELNHPEMPKERPSFTLHVDGKESWSWADIAPNWTFDITSTPPGKNPWNEQSHEEIAKAIPAVNMALKSPQN